MRLYYQLLILGLGLALVGCPDSTGSGGMNGGTGVTSGETSSGETTSGETTSGETTSGETSGGACFEDATCPSGTYCLIAEGSFEGSCVEGCKEGDCEGGRICDTDSRECVFPPCGVDTDCPSGTYCADSVCENGCRLDEACPDEFDTDGRAVLCDPTSRECVSHSPCCVPEGDVDSCVAATSDQCSELGGQLIQGALLCDDDPCGQTCEIDEDCRSLDANGATFYCDATDNRCFEGCREGECDGDLVCDLTTRLCSDLSCLSADDCATGQYCDPVNLICRTGCGEDSDCDDGFSCIDNSCVERCDPEMDVCGDGRYCDAQSLVCRDECATHDDCGESEACEPVSKQCVLGACRDDEALGALSGEPNNDFDIATRLTLVPLASDPDYSSGRAEGRVVCGGDRDLYRVSLAQGERMRITLSHEAAGNLGLRVFDSVDTSLAIATADGVEIPEVIEFPGESEIRDAGDYYIEIDGDLENEARVEYDLSVQTAPLGNACFFDVRESGAGDDGYMSATELVQGGVSRYNDGSICVGDEDWFSLGMTVNDGLIVEVRTAANARPLTFELYPQSALSGIGGVPNASYDVNFEDSIEDVDTGDRIYRLEVPFNTTGFSDGTWYLKVFGDAADSYANYRVVVDHEASNDVCVDDDYEPNNSILNGVDIVDTFMLPTDDLGLLAQGRDNRIQAVSICSGDLDFYCFDLADGDQIEAWVISNDTIGNLEVSITDSEGGQVGTEGTQTVTGDPNFDIASFLGSSAGRYCAVVDGLGNAQGTYEINIRRSVPEGGVCANDDEGAFGNDTAANAEPLADISEEQGFRFEKRNGLVCDPSVDSSDWYSFPVTTSESRICAMLEGFEHDEMLGGLDIQIFEPPAGNTTPCTTEAECFDAMTNEQNYCVGGFCQVPTTDSTYIYDFEMADMPRAFVDEGTHYIRVFADGTQIEVPYDLRVSVTPGRDTCQQDWQEIGDPNDDSRANGFTDDSRATVLGSGSVGLCDAWICDNGDGNYDDDWYSITVPAQEDRTVVINFLEGSDGGLQLYYFGQTETSMDADVIMGSTTPSYNYQCINISGGSTGAEVEMGIVSAFSFIDDGDRRIDYSLRVVPTDLSANPDGECARFGASNFSACSLDDTGQMDNSFAEGCWPTVNLP